MQNNNNNNKYINHWLHGFFEATASFSVNIGLAKSKNKRYVLFKPYINIVSVDKHQTDYLQKLLDLKFSPSKKKKLKNYHNKSYSLNIQNTEEIDKVLKSLDGYSFKSINKRNRLERFKICYEDIKKIGMIHQIWDDKFKTIIDEKLEINKNRSNINKNRFSASQWVTKIKEHLGE